MATKTLAAMLVVALAGQAFGQNALGNGTEMGNRQGRQQRAQYGLGDGRGLDLNTRSGSNGRNDQVRDFQAELQFRNSIVTGNAPNGLSFRGDLPYTAPTEFRGNTGSNDLYAYRRDSLYSGLAGMGIRGTEALQQQFGLTTGNRLPELLTGSLTVNRFGAGDPDFANKIRAANTPGGFGPGGDPSILSRVGPEEYQPDFSGLAIGGAQELGTLRNMSAYTSTRGIQPTLLDVRTTPNQDLFGVSASSLRGIQSIPLGKASVDNSVANTKNALAAGSIGVAPGRPNMPDPIPGGGRPGADPGIGSSAYLELMTRLSSYAGITSPDGGADTRAPWERQLDTMRMNLNASGLGRGPDDILGNPGLDPGVIDPVANPEATPNADPAFEPTALAPFAPVKDFKFDPATVETLRNASGQINALVPLNDQTGSAYAVFMGVGQKDLGRGWYFDAEEAFTRALAMRPDDAMALVGRVHSQIGAGTNLSAWMNLRELFKNHPEMLGAKYPTNLLPEPARLAEVTATYRDLIAGETGLYREAAMLLAYVGYQTEDKSALDEGLAAMERNKDGKSDALTDLIAAVWGGAAPESAPVPAPIEPAK